MAIMRRNGLQCVNSEVKYSGFGAVLTGMLNNTHRGIGCGKMG
jgi:hypothetical protein